MLLGRSHVAAATLIADALDVRHRLPRLWTALLAGQVRVWQARHVAARTRATGLTRAQAREVDATTTPYLATLPWGRFTDLLEARIIAADPHAAEARREAAELDRFVVTGQSNEHGLKTLIAKATAGEVIYLVAMVDRIAEILHQHGDTDPVGPRRAKALGILAHPARALALLQQGQEPVVSTGSTTREAVVSTGSTTRDVVSTGSTTRDPGSTTREVPLPPATLYVHLSRESMLTGAGVARMEGVGPITIGQASQFLRHSQVTLKPVIDLEQDHPVDAYEAPDRLRELMHLRAPASAFPWSPATGRRMDLDHTIPWGSPAVVSTGSTTRTARHPGRPDHPGRQPRPAHPARAPRQDPRHGLATPTTRARRAPLAHTHRAPRSPSTTPAPTANRTPHSNAPSPTWCAATDVIPPEHDEGRAPSGGPAFVVGDGQLLSESSPSSDLSRLGAWSLEEIEPPPSPLLSSASSCWVK